MHTGMFFAAFAIVLTVAACGGQKADQSEPRKVITITQDDMGKSEKNQITKSAGIDCIAGRRVVVEAEITGNVAPPRADALIGEALCDGQAVATAQVTAKPPIGFDTNRDVGRQTTGPAACQASWVFIPSPNTPVWTVKCTFF